MKDITVTELIEVLKEYEFGGATGRPREVNFRFRDEEGQSVRLCATELSTGDGMITDLSIYFEKIEV